jgi:hypothetical protein
MADDTGLTPKESVIETLCSWPDGLAVGGFRVSTSIPRVRLRRGRPLDPESRSRRAVLCPALLTVFLFAVAVAVGFVIGFLPDRRSWFASCAGRI